VKHVKLIAVVVVIVIGLTTNTDYNPKYNND